MRRKIPLCRFHQRRNISGFFVKRDPHNHPCLPDRARRPNNVVLDRPVEFLDFPGPSPELQGNSLSRPKSPH